MERFMFYDDYEPYENDREEFELNQLQQDREGYPDEDEQDGDAQDDGDSYPGDWVCPECHATNSKLDAGCQYCDSDDPLSIFNPQAERDSREWDRMAEYPHRHGLG